MHYALACLRNWYVSKHPTECCIVCPCRHMEVVKHFPAAMGVDDFIARLEMALAAYGFTGDNAIGEFLQNDG